MKYAGVIVDISHEKLDREFQYLIPDELADEVCIGVRVNIPFGNSKRTGYVVDITDEAQIDVSKIRPIDSVDQNSVSIDTRMIKLAYWMKRNYGATINQALKTVIPIKEKVKEERERTVSLVADENRAKEVLDECQRKHYSAQARLLCALMEYGISEYSLLLDKLNISAASFAALERKQVIKIESITKFRNAINVRSENRRAITLTDEQRAVADAITAEIEAGDNTPCLIKGVTGSGKTEVYMRLIESVLEKGGQAIVLIPEISLTYQNIMRFYNRFGNIVSVINSRLSKGERYDRFRMAREGSLKIMIGPRSALFTPFDNLRLIIIDEEHESAYQSETVPRYHARETAIELARLCNAKVVMGSATPSLEAYYRALHGEYHLYRMNYRPNGATLPKVSVVDMRKELQNGNRSMFSNELSSLIEDRLSRNEQIMLFLNRRGYQGFITCRDCGAVMECPHCAVSLTQHFDNRLYCHYCGYETEYVRRCPKCGKTHIGTFKAGTEKIEEEIKKAFPKARVLRMDMDTTKGKDGHAGILEAFFDHKADILIGTQMIVKGHDFGNVTLMGVLLADMSLHSSDYRAAEVTFELLTQAAGRAGRGGGRGDVIIQTYDPDNYSIECAQSQDYDAFYEAEIGFRELLMYPPVCHMMTVRVMSKDEGLLARVAKYFASDGDNFPGTYTIGPANAPIYKVNDVFTKLIYFKNTDNEELIGIKDLIEAQYRKYINDMNDIRILFDFR